MTNPFFADTSLTGAVHGELDLGWAFEEEFHAEEFEPVTPPLAAGWLLCEPACVTDRAFEYQYVYFERLAEAEGGPVESTHYDSAQLALRAGTGLAEGQLSDYKRSRAARAMAMHDAGTVQESLAQRPLASIWPRKPRRVSVIVKHARAR